MYSALAFTLPYDVEVLTCFSRRRGCDPYLLYSLPHLPEPLDCIRVDAGPTGCLRHALPQLVAVKAEEWQRRASKVMGQAKPQLEVVRELFHEGQELGYEELTGEGHHVSPSPLWVLSGA